MDGGLQFWPQVYQIKPLSQLPRTATCCVDIQPRVSSGQPASIPKHSHCGRGRDCLTQFCQRNCSSFNDEETWLSPEVFPVHRIKGLGSRTQVSGTSFSLNTHTQLSGWHLAVLRYAPTGTAVEAMVAQRFSARFALKLKGTIHRDGVSPRYWRSPP